MSIKFGLKQLPENLVESIFLRRQNALSKLRAVLSQSWSIFGKIGSITWMDIKSNKDYLEEFESILQTFVTCYMNYSTKSKMEFLGTTKEETMSVLRIRFVGFLRNERYGESSDLDFLCSN